MTNYRADIDGLRAVAILLVLWFHAFPAVLPGGFIGVDVFFVISGFLITGIVLRGLHKGNFSFAHFYAQRARRLLPALIVVLPATLAAGWHWLWPQEYEQLATHVAASAAFILNIVLWTEAGYFDAATELKPLMHLWSLGIEEQFYLLYPCLLWLGWRLRLNPIGVIAGMVIVSFTANLLLLASDPAGAFFLPHTRFWELALGGMLAWWQHHKLTDPGATAPICPGTTMPVWRQLLPWAGLLAIAVGALAIHPTTPYPGIASLLPAGGSLLLIAAGPHTWVNRHLLASRGMVLIGLISYPLYLWHWPILSFMRIVQVDTPPASMRWLALLLSFLLAWLTFRFVETPVRFGTRRRLRLASAIAATGIMLGLAVMVRGEQGLPERLPAEARTLLAYRYDYRAGYREGSCFLEPEQDTSGFATCPDTWSSEGQTWLLWGDSHAAHLFPGLLARHGEQAGIVQRAASGCPPLHGESVPYRPHCPAIQEFVWQEIANHRPKRVTLAARWDYYDWRKLSTTVERLRKLGAEQIELVGPVPQWRNGLPRQAAIAYRQNGFKALPLRLSQGMLPEPFKLDKEMEVFAESLRIHYLSPIQRLCDVEGCLAQNPEHPGTLSAWDDAHFTNSGSALFISKLP